VSRAEVKRGGDFSTKVGKKRNLGSRYKRVLDPVEGRRRTEKRENQCGDGKGWGVFDRPRGGALKKTVGLSDTRGERTAMKGRGGNKFIEMLRRQADNGVRHRLK